MFLKMKKKRVLIVFLFALDVLCVAFLLKARSGNSDSITEKEQVSDDEDNSTGNVSYVLHWC